MKKLLGVVLACLLTTNVYGNEKKENEMQPKISIVITLKAKPGMEKELANLLSGAADLVKETEPKTLYWFATQVDESTFTINDGFADESGVNAHFEGKVAAALKASAEKLVVGGWEKGVVNNITRSDILSTIQ